MDDRRKVHLPVHLSDEMPPKVQALLDRVREGTITDEEVGHLDQAERAMKRWAWEWAQVIPKVCDQIALAERHATRVMVAIEQVTQGDG